MTELDWHGKRWPKIVLPKGKFHIPFEWCKKHDSLFMFACYWYGREAEFYFESEEDAILFRLKFV